MVGSRPVRSLGHDSRISGPHEDCDDASDNDARITAVGCRSMGKSEEDRCCTMLSPRICTALPASHKRPSPVACFMLRHLSALGRIAALPRRPRLSSMLSAHGTSNCLLSLSCSSPSDWRTGQGRQQIRPCELSLITSGSQFKFTICASHCIPMLAVPQRSLPFEQAPRPSSI
jgi:hypothetical protein